jgi:hypothetical protein
MNTTVAPMTPQTLPMTPPKTPDPSVQDKAKDILEVGDRAWRKDDYDARLEAFGQTMGDLDAQGRQDLVAEIIEQDPGALNSWLTPQRINDLTDGGQLSQTQRNAIAEGVAGAYNDGQLPSYELHDPLGNPVGEGSALDAWTQPSGQTDGLEANVENAQQMREFAELFQGPQYSAAVSDFRSGYSQHLIENYATNEQLPNLAQRDYATMQAAVLLNGDTTRPDITAEVLNDLPNEQFDGFMERLASVSPMYGQEQMEHAVPMSTIALRDGIQPGDIALADQYAGLLSQVARTDTPDAREAAVKLARLPAQDEHAFGWDGKVGRERADALGNVLTTHTTPILDALTKNANDLVGNSDDPNKKDFMQNASELGSLLKATMLNPNSTNAGVVQSNILKYADTLKSQVNSPEGNQDAMARLGMLSGAAGVAISKGFEDIADRKDAQKQMLSFIADLALAGIPLASKSKDAVADMLGEVFDNKNVADALKGMSGKLFDSATGKLTDAAKEKLAEVVGADEAEMFTQQEAANAFRKAIKGGIENQDRLASIDLYVRDVDDVMAHWEG